MTVATNCSCASSDGQKGGGGGGGGGGGKVTNGVWMVFICCCSLLIGMQFSCSYEATGTMVTFNDATTTTIMTTTGTNKGKSTSIINNFQIQEIDQDQELARIESLNFFTKPGISKLEWIARQEWARNATFHRYPDSPKRFWDRPGLWYFYSYDPIFNCPFAKRIGGIGDGPKWTCDPYRLKRIATERKQQRLRKLKGQQQQQQQQYDCLIYSVGSNGNYNWEDGMVREIGPICEIHVFDYSKNYTRKRNKERNIHFHQWGLYGSKQEYRENFYSFQQILTKLGHVNRTIDIFKIDCEGCEWESFTDWITYDIRQLLIETHKLPKNKTKGLQFFDSFANHNFLMYSKEANPWGGGTAVEFSYIKLHPKFLHPSSSPSPSITAN